MQDEMKRHALELLAPQCPYVSLRLDDPTLRLGYFAEMGHDNVLTLRVGNDPKVLGIPDLTFTDEGWSGTLVVTGRSRVHVFVPWRAIIQLRLPATDCEHDELIMTWPILRPYEAPKKKPGLRLVDDKRAEAEVQKLEAELATPTMPVELPPVTERKCTACASCYMEPDDMNFICGHKDAGPYGIYTHQAVASEAEKVKAQSEHPGYGHCGPDRPKFVQHPLRKLDGSLKEKV